VDKIDEGANGYTGMGLFGMFRGLERTLAVLYFIRKEEK